MSQPDMSQGPTDPTVAMLLQKLVEMEKAAQATQQALAKSQETVALVLASQMRDNDALAAHFAQETEQKHFPFMREVVRLEAIGSTALNEWRNDKDAAWDRLRKSFQDSARAGTLTPEVMLEVSYLMEEEDNRFVRASALLGLSVEDRTRQHNVRVCAAMGDGQAFLKANGEGIVSVPFPFFPHWAGLGAYNNKMLVEAAAAAKGVVGGNAPRNFYPSMFAKKEEEVTGGALAVSVTPKEIGRLQHELDVLRGELKKTNKPSYHNNNNNSNKKKGGEPPAYQNHLSSSATPFVPPQPQQSAAPSSSSLPPTAMAKRGDF